MKFGVIVFPGLNCDHDAYWAFEQVLKQPLSFMWNESHDLENCDAIIVPGGSRTATTCALARLQSSLR